MPLKEGEAAPNVRNSSESVIQSMIMPMLSYTVLHYCSCWTLPLKCMLTWRASLVAFLHQVTFKCRVRDASIGGENPFTWKDVTTEDLMKGKRVVVFALPGAFTPTCSSTHLPGYEKVCFSPFFCMASLPSAFAFMFSVRVIFSLPYIQTWKEKQK